jgi:hypothetical protein
MFVYGSFNDIVSMSVYAASGGRMILASNEFESYSCLF